MVVPFLYEAFGWRGAFVATGASGFAWLMAWLLLYRMPQDHPRVSPAELKHIQTLGHDGKMGILVLSFLL